MLIPTIILGLLAAVLIILSYQKGVHIQGLKASGNMLVQIIPLLIFAFLIAGMVQFLLPHETISRWVGTESGFRGLLIGTAMGSIAPGGPFVSMPIAAGLLRMGANIGTMVAFLTAWSLLAFSRIPMELGIMGWKFVLIRLACTFFFPPVAGWIANAFFSRVNVV